MVDTSDCTIAYVPTNIYSVGTVLARWDDRLKKYVPNDDWLLWELDEPKAGPETARRGRESAEPPK